MAVFLIRRGSVTLILEMAVADARIVPVTCVSCWVMVVLVRMMVKGFLNVVRKVIARNMMALVLHGMVIVIWGRRGLRALTLLSANVMKVVLIR